MDEESILDEFKAWYSEQDVWYWLMDGATAAKAAAGKAWLEAMRRADKRAREECAEICDQIWLKERSEEGRYISEECALAIRDTIKEKQ